MARTLSQHLNQPFISTMISAGAIMATVTSSSQFRSISSVRSSVSGGCDQLVSAEEYDKASNNHLRELVKKCQNELSLEHDRCTALPHKPFIIFIFWLPFISFILYYSFRHVHLHNEECRLNDEYIQRLEDISKINNAISLAEYKHKQQKLKEELIFLTEVQKQESISLTKLLSQAPADTREIYKTKIAQTIRDINQEFNNTSQSHRKFLEDHYAGKILVLIKEILNVVKKRDEECRSRQEQVARIEKTLSELNQKFVPLEERKRMQEEECKLLRKTLLEYDEGFKAVLLEKEKQYSNSLDIYQRLNALLQLDEKQALLNFEQMLEIAIYKRMLEEEEDSTYRYRFRRFKAGEFDVSDRQRSGTPRTAKTDALKSLLDGNPSQTRKRLTKELAVFQATVFRRLHEMGKIEKLRKCVPHELSEDSIDAGSTFASH
uniref:Coiled-coil domain-containing protein 77 n=1 Tax=Heterorhabditis bacteriophora TaxID=37862 RepID=A0A1I7XN17_HETBA